MNPSIEFCLTGLIQLNDIYKFYHLREAYYLLYMRSEKTSLILDYEQYDQNQHSLEDMLINNRLSVKK